MSDPHKRASLGSALYYDDPRAALDWLERAFGFEPFMVITDEKGDIAHAEMTFGDSYIMVGRGGWFDWVATPSQVGGKNTQNVHVHLEADLDAHCERARAAGAVIQQEPTDQFYGDRTYRACDPGGHSWTFGQTVKTMTPAEWDAAAPGLTTKMYK